MFLTHGNNGDFLGSSYSRLTLDESDVQPTAPRRLNGLITNFGNYVLLL